MYSCGGLLLSIAEKCIFEKFRNYRVKDTEYFKFEGMNNDQIDSLIDKCFTEYKSFIEQ